MPGFASFGVSSSVSSTGYSFRSGFHHRLPLSASGLIFVSVALTGLGSPTTSTDAFCPSRSFGTCASLMRTTAFICDVSGSRSSCCRSRTVAPSMIWLWE
jgi:hypothetical protein